MMISTRSVLTGLVFRTPVLPPTTPSAYDYEQELGLIASNTTGVTPIINSVNQLVRSDLIAIPQGSAFNALEIAIDLDHSAFAAHMIVKLYEGQEAMTKIEAGVSRFKTHMAEYFPPFISRIPSLLKRYRLRAKANMLVRSMVAAEKQAKASRSMRAAHISYWMLDFRANNINYALRSKQFEAIQKDTVDLGSRQTDLFEELASFWETLLDTLEDCPEPKELKIMVRQMEKGWMEKILPPVAILSLPQRTNVSLLASRGRLCHDQVDSNCCELGDMFELRGVSIFLRIGGN